MLKKIRQTNLYNNLFGFESNIDITKDVLVLFRKNVVIKNIVLLSNLIYTLIFSIVSIGERSNWFLTLLCIPVTYLVNRTLKKMIYKDKENYLRQQIAMYICCFYMFLSALLIYTRLKTGLSNSFFGEAGYILLYYSLVICSFYQSKKLLRSVYPWVIVLLTIIHFSITYNVIFNNNLTAKDNYLIIFLKSYEFRDIILRTFILLIFMLVLYISVSITEYLSEERKKELIRRQEVEKNYNEVVSDLFKIALNPKPRTKAEENEGLLLSDMSYKLATFNGLTETEALKIKKYANIHLIAKIDLDIPANLASDERFKRLSEESKLASLVLRRLQLERKTEDIIRAHLEGAADLIVENNQSSAILDQVVMLCDMYISLRSARTYKRAINHNNTINLLETVYRIYFDPLLFDRFLRYSEDFRDMFDNFKEDF